ncbi:MAG TPA: hypothetical protein PKY59_05840 [Pyrinomonadaceae bacterium]|nr:hypothetical protein [Pyrinomonadaceae bacterium]
MKYFLTFSLFFLSFIISCQTGAENFENTQNAAAVLLSPTLPDTKTSAEIDEIDLKIGNVQSGKQSVCLKIRNPNLKVGDAVQIIVSDEERQDVLQAEIAEKSSCRQTDFGTLDEIDVTDYLLKSNDKSFLDRGYAFGVVNAAEKARVDGKTVNLDMKGDKKPVYFRQCTSMEGLHLTVWRGKPLIGKRIWHSYYSLGYDTVPDCKKKDYED